MKSQDILLVVKLVGTQLCRSNHQQIKNYPHDWFGWDDGRHKIQDDFGDIDKPAWTYQQLAQSIGISASECHASVKRCLQNHLLRHDRQSHQPIPVVKNFEEFCIHGLKYVFPVEFGTLVRGIPTTYAAPVLANRLFSSGEHCYVWPDGQGKQTGIALMPIHPSVPRAVRDDPIVYELLALIDAMRVGKPREADLTKTIFSQLVRQQ